MNTTPDILLNLDYGNGSRHEVSSCARAMLLSVCLCVCKAICMSSKLPDCQPSSLSLIVSQGKPSLPTVRIFQFSIIFIVVICDASATLPAHRYMVAQMIA